MHMVVWDLKKNEESHSLQFYEHFANPENFIRTGYTLYEFGPDDQENFAKKWNFSQQSIMSNHS